MKVFNSESCNPDEFFSPFSATVFDESFDHEYGTETILSVEIHPETTGFLYVSGDPHTNQELLEIFEDELPRRVAIPISNSTTKCAVCQPQYLAEFRANGVFITLHLNFMRLEDSENF